MKNLEIENARLRAWLETIQKTAAEVRIIDMATMALAGNDQALTKTKPAFTAATAEQECSRESAN